MDYGAAIKLAIIGLLLCFGCAWIMESVSAGLVYSMNTTITNDPLSPVARQGDTLYLGKTYDFSMLAGFSREYAYWQNWKLEDLNCDPDKVVDTRYWSTLTNREAVYLDPAVWNIGDWWQWDGYECNMSRYDYESHQWVKIDKPLQADNKFAFTIMSVPVPKVETLITHADYEKIDPYKPLYP